MDEPQVPRNLEAERALLGAFQLDPRQYDKLRGRLTAAIFTHPVYREMAKAMATLRDRGMDLNLVAIRDEIERTAKGAVLFRNNQQSIKMLAETVGTDAPSRGAETYLRMLEESANKRIILRASEDFRAMAQNGATADDLARVFRTYAKRMESILSTTEGVRTVDVEGAMEAEVPPIPWLVEGWMGEGDVVTLAGEPGSGKSIIALDLAIAVACGIPWMSKIAVLKQGPALYLDEENNQRNILRRLGRMLRGRGIESGAPIPLRYLSKNALRIDTPKGLATLTKELEMFRPTLVVMDSLIRFHGASENDNTEIAAVFAQSIVPLATRFQCAFVILDHMRKPSKDDDRFDSAHRIRGAGDKLAVADAAWTLEVPDRERDGRILSCRKSRWDDSLPPTLATRWRVSDDDTMAWVEAKDAVLSAEVNVPRVLERFPGGLLATDLYAELAALGTPKRTAVRKIQSLVRNGQVSQRKEPGGRVRYWVGTLHLQHGF